MCTSCACSTTRGSAINTYSVVARTSARGQTCRRFRLSMDRVQTSGFARRATSGAAMPIETERLKQRFRTERPNISRALAEDLWRLWRDLGTDCALFEDAEHDVALQLHLRAYGLLPNKAYDK